MKAKKPKTTKNLKVMDGVKQKPEKRDMSKPTKMRTPEGISNK